MTPRKLGRAIAFLALLGLLAPFALADGVPPVTLKLREQESGRFLAEWRVPRMLPAASIPTPVFPESCRTIGEQNLDQRPGAWFVRQSYRCADGLSGHSIGIEFPFLNATISTLLQVELRSGVRHAHLLAPGETSWRVPDAAAGRALRWFRGARRAVVDGGLHFNGHGLHYALALAFVLIGGPAVSVRLATGFTVGQLAGVLSSRIGGIALDPPLAEVGIAAVTVLLAREALRPVEDRRSMVLPSSAAGLLHGLGLASLISLPADHVGSPIAYYTLAVLGTDALLLVVVLLASEIRRLPVARGSRAAAYTLGICAVALLLGFPVGGSASASPEAPAGIRLPELPVAGGATGAPSAIRVTSPFPDAALQSFITIAPFEVRHEVLVRVGDLAGRIDLDPTGELAVDDQDEAKRRVRQLVEQRTDLTINRQAGDPVERRVEFLTLDGRGALPRPAPVPETITEAWLGVTTVYVTEQTPGEVVLTWRGFDDDPSVGATITDPESTLSVELTAQRPSVGWSNLLSEDPTPVVEAVAVEPPAVRLPMASLALAFLAAGMGIAALRGAHRPANLVVARLSLACAFLVAPQANVVIPLPFSVDRTPGEEESKRILSRLLPGVYRAFEFPTESTVYDRLALCVTGDTLTEVYLEHRRAVTMEERGGARARVEAVEVLKVAGGQPGEAGGFVTDATWTVGGTVTHFGHRHFRQNRYEAKVTVLPVDGQWKIRSIQVLDERRLR